MSTTTTFEVAVCNVDERLRLASKKSGIVVVKLPRELQRVWEEKFKRRNPRPLTDEDIERNIKNIVVGSIMPDSRDSGLKTGSQLTLSFPASTQYPTEEIFWTGVVERSPVTVTF